VISLHIAHSPNARDCMGTKFYQQNQIRVYVNMEFNNWLNKIKELYPMLEIVWVQSFATKSNKRLCKYGIQQLIKI